MPRPEEEINRKEKTDSRVQDTDSFMINPEAENTEGIVDFMHEEIKKRPVNRRKLFRRAQETVVIGLVFGVVSCIVFAILLPVINNVLYPKDDGTETVTLPEEKPGEELTPEEMVQNERSREASEEREWIREELQKALDDNVVGIDQQKKISAAMQEVAVQSSHMLVMVSGIHPDTDWFNDAYENRNTVCGLVTKKTADMIYILVQSRRITDANRIIVTFYGDVEAEAQIAGTDETTGLTVLSVRSASIPAGLRSSIEEASTASSAAGLITGAPVIAVGSPTGTYGSVIYGNVTGAGGRLDILDNDLTRLTTDIYGSSDATGFLINLDGAVVGMIDMRYRDSNVPNMLCAIGISELRPIIHRMENGDTKSFLGILGTDVSEAISTANNIPVGVWVSRVEEDSPAMEAGLQKGDIITGFNKNEILHMAGLIVQLENSEPGDTVMLSVQRQTGGSYGEIRISVTLQ